MRMLWSVALAVSAASVVLGQRPARIGPDGKPLLNRPVLEECQKSKLNSNLKKLTAAKVSLPNAQEFLTCNGADTITSCRGGNHGTSSKTGTGSTDATFAGIDAWTWSALTLLENTGSLQLSLAKVSNLFQF